MKHIDLKGPEGNAFALMGLAKNYLQQMGWSKEEIKEYLNEMMKGDYNNLLEMFQEQFGSFVELEGLDNE
jgi:hypothetical protein